MKKYKVISFLVLLTLFVSWENAFCTLKTTQSFDLIPPSEVFLSCKYYPQTTDYTCGPAAVMALLHYYGKLKTGEMNQVTELRIAHEMGTLPGQGTTPEQMVSWLQKNGFNAKPGRRITTFILEENLNRGIPTLVVVEDHWTLSTGYKKNENNNNNEDAFYFTDSCVKTRKLTSSEVDSLWLKTFCKGRQCNSIVGDYIIAVPLK